MYKKPLRAACLCRCYFDKEGQKGWNSLYKRKPVTVFDPVTGFFVGDNAMSTYCLVAGAWLPRHDVRRPWPV